MNNVKCTADGGDLGYFFKVGGVYATTSHPDLSIGELLVIDPYGEKWNAYERSAGVVVLYGFETTFKFI